MIHVNNLQDKVSLPDGTEQFLIDLGQVTLANAGRDPAEVGITLADDTYLQELNRNYRGIDAPTDVLSFALDEAGEGEPGYEQAGPELLGDVIISVERAAAQAEEYGHSLRREMAYLAVHGLLHLLGYDHDGPEQGAQMRRTEEEILAGHNMANE